MSIYSFVSEDENTNFFQMTAELFMLQLPAVIAMQAHWRGYAQWKKYTTRLQYFRDNEESIIKVSAIKLSNVFVSIPLLL